jgi:hypothetical protein
MHLQQSQSGIGKPSAVPAAQKKPDEDPYGRGQLRRLHSPFGRRKQLQNRFARVLPQIVENRSLLDAIDRAEGGTTLHGFILSRKVRERILIQRDCGIATLLRAPVDKALLADIQVPASGVAVPVVRHPAPEVVLEPVIAEKGEYRFAQLGNLVEDKAFVVAKWPDLSGSVVKHPGRDAESQ